MPLYFFSFWFFFYKRLFFKRGFLMLRLLVQIKLFIKIHCLNQLIMKVCSFIYKLQRLSLSAIQVPSIKSVRSWFQFTFPKHPQKWGFCVSGTTLKLIINQWLVLKLHCLTNDLKINFFCCCHDSTEIFVCFLTCLSED